MEFFYDFHRVDFNRVVLFIIFLVFLTYLVIRLICNLIKIKAFVKWDIFNHYYWFNWLSLLNILFSLYSLLWGDVFRFISLPGNGIIEKIIGWLWLWDILMAIYIHRLLFAYGELLVGSISKATYHNTLRYIRRQICFLTLIWLIFIIIVNSYVSLIS